MPIWIRFVLALAALKVGVGLTAGFVHPLAPGDGGALFGAWIYAAVSLAFASVGALLIWIGGDSRAVYLGAVFALVAAMFAERFLAPFATGTGPLAAAFGFLFAVDPVAFRPHLVWRFAAAFPRPVTFGWPRRLVTAMLRLTLVGGVLFFAVSAVAAMTRLRSSTLDAGSLSAFNRQQEGSLYWLFLTPLTLLALVQIGLNARSASPLERRRSRVFVAGLLLGTGPILLEVLLELLVPPFAGFMSRPDVRRTTGLVVYPLLISIPISTGYAVLVDQVLSVRLVFRTAIRYALARVTILALCVIPFVLLVWIAWRAWRGGLEVLGGGRVVALGGLLIAALVLLLVRQKLLVAVDRQFFREQYDAREILGALVHQSRGARNLSELSVHLSQGIDRALHVESFAVMVADVATRSFVPVVSAVEPLVADASLVTLLGGATEPMDVRLEQPRSIVARLPLAERQWLADGGFQLLVPMLAGSGALVGILAIGRKKSELPFSREDRWLLSAIASSSALAIENLQLRTPDVMAVRAGLRAPEEGSAGLGDAPGCECVSCGLVQPQHTTACQACGSELRESPIPLVVRGTYRIERLLGRGGMGVVYQASDLSLGRRVAIKTLPAVSPERALRLRREAKAMALVAHPKLAMVYAIELWRGTPLIVVECLQQTLQDRLRIGSLVPDEAVRVAVELAEGLEALHTAGILHRDVKPSNIGFTATGTPKLLDFGLAKVVRHTQAVIPPDGDPSASTMTAEAPEPLADSVTPPLQMIGTPLYLSPETVQLKPPDASVDLWALSLVLYESIAGTHPMRAATPFETMARIAKAQVPDIREYRPDCPPGIAGFLQQALHADRRRRPGTAREFRFALGEAVQAALAS